MMPSDLVFAFYYFFLRVKMRICSLSSLKSEAEVDVHIRGQQQVHRSRGTKPDFTEADWNKIEQVAKRIREWNATKKGLAPHKLHMQLGLHIFMNFKKLADSYAMKTIKGRDCLCYKTQRNPKPRIILRNGQMYREAVHATLQDHFPNGKPTFEELDKTMKITYWYIDSWLFSLFKPAGSSPSSEVCLSWFTSKISCTHCTSCPLPHGRSQPDHSHAH